MDPLSITASIISLASYALQVGETPQGLESDKAFVVTAVAEVDIYALISREVSDIALQSAEVPSSATKCMQLYHKHLEVLNNQASAKHPKADDIRSALSDFRSTVMLLRDIVME